MVELDDVIERAVTNPIVKPPLLLAIQRRAEVRQRRRRATLGVALGAVVVALMLVGLAIRTGKRVSTVDATHEPASALSSTTVTSPTPGDVTVPSSDHRHSAAVIARGSSGFCVDVDDGQGPQGCATEAIPAGTIWFIGGGKADPRGATDSQFRDAYGGGAVVGKVSDKNRDATYVEISLPQVGVVRAELTLDGFFVVDLPEAAWRATLAGEPIGPVEAFADSGALIARGQNVAPAGS